MNEPEIAVGCFVIAGSQAAGALELVEAAFHPVSEGVGDAVDEDWFFPVGPSGDDWSATTPGNYTANVIAVVATVGDEHSGLGKIVIDERVEPFEVGDFATTYLRPDRQSVSVGNEVDFGREATF